MKTPNPSHSLLVAQIASDPAFDRAAEGFREAAQRYVKTRHPDDLAAVPRIPGQSPVLYKIRALTPEERSIVLGLTALAQQHLMAARLAVRAVIEQPTFGEGGVSGPERALEITTGGKSQMLTDEALAALHALGGGELIDELGELAIQRASVHPRALAPFTLPSHLAVSR